MSRMPVTAVRSYGARSSSTGVFGSSTSRTISVSTRFIFTASRWSRRFCPATPLTSSARAISSSNVPNWLIHFAAVFSPTFGMLGRLSDGSPRRAAKSGYCRGVSPYFSTTFSGVNRVSSETPFVGYSTVTLSVINWKESRSPVTISTSNPASSAWVASVAMTSSASNPSTANRSAFIASSSSPISSTCPLNSSGVLERFALYSGNSSDRHVLRDTSNATAKCVGASSRNVFASIDMKPYTAFVGWPTAVVKFSAGRAKNARYARECPSMRSRRGRLSAVFFDAVSATPPILPRPTDNPGLHRLAQP